MGKWIKHSTLYPSWFLRFYRPDRIRYPSMGVHEYPEVDGPVGMLNGHLLHYSFAKGLEEWLLKHVRYARLEAIENLKNMDAGWSGLDLRGVISMRNPVRRRRALKEFSFRLPMRPFLRFAYMYLLRRGFLDGVAGYRYCRMIAMYQSMTLLHMNDLRHNAEAEKMREACKPQPSRGICNDLPDGAKAPTIAAPEYGHILK
jgi:hypothetical protein